jgi:hypothetical protein
MRVSLTGEEVHEVTGTQDGALLFKLTAPNTRTTGTLTLEGSNLSIDGKFALDFPWVRTNAKSPAAAP